MSDELDVLRPLVRAGEPADGRGAGDHPPIDAWRSSGAAAPRPTVGRRLLRPPDPLGVLDLHDHVVTPADPPARRSRRLLGAAVVVALIAVGVAVVAGTRDDDPDAGGVVAGATAAVSAPPRPLRADTGRHARPRPFGRRRTRLQRGGVPLPRRHALPARPGERGHRDVPRRVRRRACIAPRDDRRRRHGHGQLVLLRLPRRGGLGRGRRRTSPRIGWPP